MPKPWYENVEHLEQFVKSLEKYNYPNREEAMAQYKICLKCSGKLVDRFDLGICYNCRRNSGERPPYTVILSDLEPAGKGFTFQIIFQSWVPDWYRQVMHSAFKQALINRVLTKDFLTKEHVNLLKDYDNSIRTRLLQMKAKIEKGEFNPTEFWEVIRQIENMADRIPVEHLRKELVNG